MSLATAELPTDPDAPRAFALACQGELKAAELAVQYKTLEIEKLKFQLAKLRRMQFGRSSERINRQIAQLELRLEELESAAAEDDAKAEAQIPDPAAAATRKRNKPKRKPLPDHLPREEVVHQPAGDGACTCPECGRGMSKLGEDITEVLDYVPGHFQVIRHVRPKWPELTNWPPGTHIGTEHERYAALLNASGGVRSGLNPSLFSDASRGATQM
jgi:hypothetical protein